MLHRPAVHGCGACVRIAWEIVGQVTWVARTLILRNPNSIFELLFLCLPHKKEPLQQNIQTSSRELKTSAQLIAILTARKSILPFSNSHYQSSSTAAVESLFTAYPFRVLAVTAQLQTKKP